MTEYEKNTGMTFEAHRNRILLKGIIYGGILTALLIALRRQKKKA